MMTKMPNNNRLSKPRLGRLSVSDVEDCHFHLIGAGLLRRLPQSILEPFQLLLGFLGQQ
jgi:hypothetical protein